MLRAPALCKLTGLIALLAMGALLLPAGATAVQTLADAGWWSSYPNPATTWWTPTRVAAWRDEIVVSTEGVDPFGHPNPGFFAWDGQSWRKLHGTRDPGQVEWCVWRDRIVAPGGGANRVVSWDGTEWQPMGAPLPESPVAVAGAEDRLLVSTRNGVYEWMEPAWRRLGPPARLGINQLVLVQGEPVAICYSYEFGHRVLRLHAGAWQTLESIPYNEWASMRPIVVAGGRLFAAYVEPDDSGGPYHSRVVRLDGDRWAPVGEWIPGAIDRLFDDGGRPGVAVEIEEPWMWETTRILPGLLMRWTGDAWEPASEFLNGPIVDAAPTDAGPVVVGYFSAAGGTRAPGVARMGNGLWRPLGDMSRSGADGLVNAMITYHDELVVAGGFVTVGGQVRSGIARGDGAHWHPLGGGVNDAVFALTEFQGDLIAAGEFTKAGDDSTAFVARWDGTAWHPLGAGFDDRVQALGLYHGELYAGGWFKHSGARECRGIARWDGVAWVPVAGGVDDHVTSFAQFNNELVVGGEFRHAGGTAARYLARYDGAEWHALPAEVNGGVLALSVWRDRLVAGGRFHRAGTVAAPTVALWDGAAWSAPTTAGYPSQAWAVSLGNYQGDLVVGWDSGNIPAPFPNNNFAIWSGRDWRVPETVATGAVRATAQFGRSLFIGGEFRAAGGRPAQNIARWDGTLVGTPLTESSAFRNGATAELAWVAPGVSNHTGYEVWRESDGAARVKLGFVAAAADGRYAFSDEAPEAGAADYWLRELGPLGSEEWRGPISLAPLPAGVQLRVPTPNPFRATTALTFTLERAGRIGLRVFDVQGRPLRTLLDEPRPAGVYTQEWDGRDDGGASVASGFYWLRVSSDAGSAARRVLYLR